MNAPIKQPLVVALRCPECLDAGHIKLWSPGKPETTCMARCEQCSGTSQMQGKMGSVR